MTPDISRAAKAQRLLLLTGASGAIAGGLPLTLPAEGERGRARPRMRTWVLPQPTLAPPWPL